MILKLARITEAGGMALLAGTIVAILEFGAFYPSTALALAVGAVAALLVLVVWFRQGPPPKCILDLFALTGWILSTGAISGLVALYTLAIPPQTRSILLPFVVIAFLSFIADGWLRYLLPYDPNYADHVTPEPRETLPFWPRFLLTSLLPAAVAGFAQGSVSASAPKWEHTTVFMIAFALVLAPELYLLEHLQKGPPAWWLHMKHRFAKLAPWQRPKGNV